MKMNNMEGFFREFGRREEEPEEEVEGTALVPYEESYPTEYRPLPEQYYGEEQVEAPSMVIDAEFRELDPEPVPEPGEVRSSSTFREKYRDWKDRYESWKVGRKRAGLARDIESFEELKGRKIPWARAKTELEELKSERRKFQRQYRPRVSQKVTGAVGKPKIVRKELYMPSGMRELTSPKGITGMRRLTAPVGQRGPSPFGYEKLRQATTLGPSRSTHGASMGDMPIAQFARPSTGMVSQGSIDSSMERLRQLIMGEVRSSPGPDLKPDLVEKLVQMGFPKGEASSAINSLVKSKALVQRGSFGGKPVLEERK